MALNVVNLHEKKLIYLKKSKSIDVNNVRFDLVLQQNWLKKLNFAEQSTNFAIYLLQESPSYLKTATY